MYAHQAIEDLRHLTKEFNRNINLYQIPDADKERIISFIRVTELLPPLIQKAQHFHMGDVEDIKKVFLNSMKDKNLFTANIEMLKLPYPVIWFDFTFKKAATAELAAPETIYKRVTNSKEAVLVCSCTKTLWVATPMTYFKESGIWSPAAVQFLIAIGGLSADQNFNDAKMFFPKRLIGDWADGNIYPLYNLNMPQNEKNIAIKEAALNIELLECAIKLLNCKNISTEKIIAPAKLNKKRKAQGKQPVFDYHVLNLILPSQKKSEYREATEANNHVRVHLCRGHFKEYTQEHPLFGKLTGLYWWQPHVRGQNHEGMIVKEYKTTLQEGDNEISGRL